MAPRRAQIPQTGAGASAVSPDRPGLVVEGLRKSYKRRPVVRDVSLSVRRGEAVGLLGPNGAGKTTVFYMITGLIAADSGRISLDGADAATNDPVRGEGSYATAIRAMDNLAAAGFGPFKISVVVTRHNVSQLDRFKALADSYGAQLRITRLRPAGRGADTWHQLHPTNEQQRQIYNWLLAHGENVCLLYTSPSPRD